jgi:hypothetical protein
MNNARRSPVDYASAIQSPGRTQGGPIDHASASRFLGKLNVRKLAPGTIIMRGSRGTDGGPGSGDIHVVHDRTAIVSFHTDGTFTLNIPDEGPIANARDRWSKFLRAVGYRLVPTVDHPSGPYSVDGGEWLVVRGAGEEAERTPLASAFRMPVRTSYEDRGPTQSVKPSARPHG